MIYFIHSYQQNSKIKSFLTNFFKIKFVMSVYPCYWTTVIQTLFLGLLVLLKTQFYSLPLQSLIQEQYKSHIKLKLSYCHLLNISIPLPISKSLHCTFSFMNCISFQQKITPIKLRNISTLKFRNNNFFTLFILSTFHLSYIFKYYSTKPSMSLVVQGTALAPEFESNDTIESTYDHRYVEIDQNGHNVTYGKVAQQKYRFKTRRHPGRVGLMLVGMGGNNGTTLIGGLIANKNKLTWKTKKGEHTANMYGSMTQHSTMKVGQTEDSEVFLKLKDVFPLLDPTQLVIAGWDINSDNLADAMNKAEVFDYDLQQKLMPYMKRFTPMKSIYYPDFIASNQTQRANNVIEGQNKKQHMEMIRKNIRDFKKENNLDKVLVLWTANTERFTVIQEHLHGTYKAIMDSIEKNESQISPSTIFALAAMEEGCAFINGSPQNTFLPGMAEIKTGIYVGNDFKTGQTKFKTAFMDFLTGAGIKPKSIVSYNHLGNNDGKNLSSEKQFKSKQTSKSECIADILENSKLFESKSKVPAKHPDHTVVIKYVPASGDSKKAIDEYVSEIFMGGEHIFTSYNVCEDSLLAAGIIIDLLVMTELMTRISYQKEGEEEKPFQGVMSFLGYLMKAPESVGPTINSLNRQRNCIQNLIRILSGLPLEDNLLFNFRL